MNKVSKFVVITGLPGSGKTTLAKTYRNASIFNLDEMDSIPYLGKKTTFVIEGLIGTHFAFYKTMEYLLKIAKSTKKWKDLNQRFQVEIVSFKEDREACLWNDSARYRMKDSSITIRNMNISIPKGELIKEYPRFKFSFSSRNVRRAADYKVWLTNLKKSIDYTPPVFLEGRLFNSHPNGRALVSDQDLWLSSKRWSMGGDWYDYTGHGGKVDSEEAPETFKAFDNLLAIAAPSATPDQLKELKERCVEVVSTYEGDYYGGSVDYNQFLCNIENLYETLVEIDLIK